MNEIVQLPEQTVKLITTSQIITSPASATKELIENSIDSFPSQIQVKVENYGLDLIEVKDDGVGVSTQNVYKMCLSGHTSKINNFCDLDELTWYGFRGEALAALCKVSNVVITTKTAADTLAMTYEIDSNGVPVSSKPSHLSRGTLVSVSNLFCNLPVRRLYLSSKKKLSEEIKKIENVVQSLSLIHPELSVVLIHNKCPVWKKNPVKCLKQSFMQVSGLKTVSKMDYIRRVFDQTSVDLIVPKKNLQNTDHVFSSSPASVYCYVNKRPVKCKIVSEPVQEHIFYNFRDSNISQKYAVCLVSINTHPREVDVNLDPNKTSVLLKNKTKIITLVDQTLREYFEHDFKCSALKVHDEVASEELPVSKRLKLNPNESCTDEESINQTQDWEVEIIDDNNSQESNALEVFHVSGNSICEKSTLPQSLCSQINSENNVLTNKEVSDFNTKLTEANHKLLVCNNDSEARLAVRNDIQEKPILKEWPIRPRVVVESQSVLSESTAKKDISDKVKVVEEPQVITTETQSEKDIKEIADEIEKSAQIWSSEVMRTVIEEEFEKDKQLENDANEFDLSLQSISSQLNKKDMKAFTKFARIMRPKISLEYPNISFIQIAGILTERWKALTADEVKYYEKMADVVDINRKIHRETKKLENIQPPEKLKKPAQTKNLKCLLDIKSQKKFTRLPRRETPFLVSIDDVKKARKDKINIAVGDLRVIGQLQPSGSWLYMRGSIIGHIRHQGLQEAIEFQKMLNNYCVPRRKLENKILVNEENLGCALWKTLLSLETEWDSITSQYVVTSDAIQKNGFYIEVYKIGGFVSSASIVEIAEAIPHYGISDLKEILTLYEKKEECGDLASLRPTAVTNLLTNEAIRIAHESAKPPDSETIENMVNTYHLCYKHLLPVCLHDRQLFPDIFNLEKITAKVPKIVDELLK